MLTSPFFLIFLSNLFCLLTSGMLDNIYHCRLLCKYSDWHCDASGQIVSSSRSTPIHFPAVNRHTNIVHMFILRGTHTDCADKHGITPEMVVRENGMKGTVQVVREWWENVISS